MLGLAGLAACGTATELTLIGHWHSPTMLVPWLVLAGGAVAIWAVATAPHRRRLQAVRLFAVAAGGGAWWGAVEHLTANARFAQELHPTWSRVAILWAGTRGGVPALAPLAVALPALLAAAASIGHPALVVGHGPAAAGSRAGRVGPTARFVLAAIVALAAVLAITGAASTRIAEREAIKDAKTSSAVYLRTVIEPELRAGLANRDPTAVAALDTAVRDRLLSDQLVRVKVWGADGTVLYSDATELVGEHYELAEDDVAALASGSSEAEITHADRPENRFEAPLGKLLEVYTGAKLDSGEPVLVEIYHSYDSVTSRSREVFRTLAPVAFGSLAILQLLQFPLARSLVRQVRRHDAERRELARRSTDAAENERRRIAANLHDGSIQNLTGLALTLDADGRTAEAENNPYATRLVDAARKIRREMRALRSLVIDLSPPLLVNEGFGVALDALAAPLRQEGTTVEIDVPPGLAEDHAGRAMLYRVVQEALRNVHNHANASYVTIVVRETSDALHVQVTDDGTGIDPDVVAAKRVQGHLGLELLAHTVHEAGGELQVTSEPSAGVTVAAHVPRAHGQPRLNGTSSKREDSTLRTTTSGLHPR